MENENTDTQAGVVDEEKDSVVEVTPAVEVKEVVKEEVKPTEETVVETDDDADDDNDTDEDTLISLSEAKKLRQEHRSLRKAKNSLAAENETLTKELETLRSKVEAFETEKAEIEKSKLVTDVKTKFNIPEKLVKYLTGDTVEELEKSAKELSEAFEVKSPVDYSNLHNGDGNKNAPVDYSKLSPSEVRAMVRTKKLK